MLIHTLESVLEQNYDPAELVAAFQILWHEMNSDQRVEAIEFLGEEGYI